ncbi:12740_t:CDS:2 [Ambispora gerdemannii]|uniref:12740_t:CDS:1 n=1 Tax=Ambispora gerdemannii TaxID=144530 RepID=A0A9N9FAC0_9GLOM|nr:12740_t:CDS:2 [Ambispora gerdemannii]
MSTDNNNKQCNKLETELSRKPTRIQRIKRSFSMGKSPPETRTVKEESGTFHSAECLLHEHNLQAESSKADITRCTCRKSSSSRQNSQRNKFLSFGANKNNNSSSSVTVSGTDLPSPKVNDDNSERKNIVRRSWSQVEVRHLRNLFDLRRVYRQEIKRRNSYTYTNSPQIIDQLAGESEIRAMNSRGGNGDSMCDYIFGDLEEEDLLAAGQESHPPLDLFEFQAQEQKATDVTSRCLQMRRFKAFEIYSSEHSYLNHLRTLKKLFMDPCYEAAKKPNPTMNPADIQLMYAHIIDIIRLSSKLVRSLAKIQPWLDDECRVGEIFLEYSKEFEVYQLYADNHLDSRAAMERIDQKTLYRKFVQGSRSKDRNRLDLSGYLIMPIQRISRYRLLLQELMKHTLESHPDFDDLSLALKQMTARVAECNSVSKLPEVR